MSVTRTYDPSVLKTRGCLLTGDVRGFDPEELTNSDNYVLLDDNDNVCLFEKVRDKVYRGHYFFKNGGKVGLASAKAFLSYVFEDGAEVVTGLTPLNNKPALFMTARLGFENYGTIETPLGDMRLSILYKKDYT